MTHNQLLTQLKEHFSNNGYPLDFRRDVYCRNSYGCTPTLRYETTKAIVLATYRWCHNFIEENKHCYPSFSGWEFNTEMEVDKLRSTKIKMFIEDKINTLVNYYEETPFSIIGSVYSEDMGAEIETVLGTKEVTFYVQLSGGEYLSQMGCWVTTDEPDCDGDIYWGDYCGFDFDEIIKCAEECYQEYIKNELLDDGEDWSEVETVNCGAISATSYLSFKIEKNPLDEYRVIPASSGFTQPNDYSSKPNFFIKNCSDLEDANAFIKNWRR